MTASRISVRRTSSFGCRLAGAAAIARLERGAPSAGSPKTVGATRATLAALSAEEGNGLVGTRARWRWVAREGGEGQAARARGGTGGNLLGGPPGSL